MLVDYAKVDPWSVDDAYYIADGLGGSTFIRDLRLAPISTYGD